jgi:hypothetical protein
MAIIKLYKTKKGGAMELLGEGKTDRYNLTEIEALVLLGIDGDGHDPDKLVLDYARDPLDSVKLTPGFKAQYNRMAHRKLATDAEWADLEDKVRKQVELTGCAYYMIPAAEWDQFDGYIIYLDYNYPTA